MNVWQKLSPERFNPILVIEWVVALCTIVSPVFIFSPLYDESVSTNGPGLVAASLSDPHLIYIYAAILLVGSIMVMVGLIFKRAPIKSVGLFTILLIRFFQVLTTLLVEGFTPIGGWIFPLTILLIVCVLWINTRVEVDNGRS